MLPKHAWILEWAVEGRRQSGENRCQLCSWDWTQRQGLYLSLIFLEISPQKVTFYGFKWSLFRKGKFPWSKQNLIIQTLAVFLKHWRLIVQNFVLHRAFFSSTTRSNTDQKLLIPQAFHFNDWRIQVTKVNMPFFRLRKLYAYWFQIHFPVNFRMKYLGQIFSGKFIWSKNTKFKRHVL